MLEGHISRAFDGALASFHIRVVEMGGLVLDQVREAAAAGESVFLPRQTAHAWVSTKSRPVRILDVYQPAGRMEEFFRKVGKYSGGVPIHEALSYDEFCRLFRDHGIEVVGPPLAGEWKVEGGRIVPA